MARFAMEVNDATENIGARRLATVLETVLEDVSFEGGTDGPRAVRIDAAEVRRRLAPLVKNQDLSRFIL
jgi:ATP-dependent HslUV protease ATP-binding subunit HslU